MGNTPGVGVIPLNPIDAFRYANPQGMTTQDLARAYATAPAPPGQLAQFISPDQWNSYSTAQRENVLAYVLNNPPALTGYGRQHASAPPVFTGGAGGAGGGGGVFPTGTGAIPFGTPGPGEPLPPGGPGGVPGGGSPTLPDSAFNPSPGGDGTDPGGPGGPTGGPGTGGDADPDAPDSPTGPDAPTSTGMGLGGFTLSAPVSSAISTFTDAMNSPAGRVGVGIIGAINPLASLAINAVTLGAQGLNSMFSGPAFSQSLSPGFQAQRAGERSGFRVSGIDVDPEGTAAAAAAAEADPTGQEGIDAAVGLGPVGEGITSEGTPSGAAVGGQAPDTGGGAGAPSEGGIGPGGQESGAAVGGQATDTGGGTGGTGPAGGEGAIGEGGQASGADVGGQAADTGGGDGGGGGGGGDGGCYLATWTLNGLKPKDAAQSKKFFREFYNGFMRLQGTSGRRLFSLYQVAAKRIMDAAERRGPRETRAVQQEIYDRLVKPTGASVEKHEIAGAVKNLVEVVSDLAVRYNVPLSQEQQSAAATFMRGTQPRAFGASTPQNAPPAVEQRGSASQGSVRGVQPRMFAPPQSGASAT